MVHVKFTAHPRTPIVSPSLSPMASESVADISVERRGSSTKQLDTTVADEQATASTEATSNRMRGPKIIMRLVILATVGMLPIMVVM
jgi:hypothetical protein